MRTFIIYFICYFAIPLWMLMGLLDWFFHRQTRIETNSGMRESIIHVIMLVEMGIPILAALLLEVNALVFLIAIVMFLIHEVTALWDVNYAHTRRYLSPFEQHVHSFLELMPLLILSMLAALHWAQFLALLGAGPDAANFDVRWKTQPLPTTYLIGVFTGVIIFQLIPYAEELWRCWRYRLTKSETL